ncbi:MAG: hypothetical protein K0R53_719 [Burkholderiales bacterium]|nr:hypothetical protein [Burkholderiales bacterium]
MIVYELGCANRHRFEGWFTSRDDFKRQLEGKLLTCPLCGDGAIERLPHASYVNTGAPGAAVKAQQEPPQQYANLGAEVLAKLIDHIIETTDDVGAAFPEEARKIHYGEIDERRIRGTASVRDIDALQEEGIEVAALPIPAHRLGKSH